MWACLCGIIAPLLVSFSMEKFENDKAFGWNCVFYVTIVYILIGITCFDLFASASVQSWAENKFVKADEFSRIESNKFVRIDNLKKNKNDDSVQSPC